MRALWTLALTLGLTTGCGGNAGEKLLKQAKDEQAKGKLDAALATLEVLQTKAPKSPEAREARPLAASWLLAAARTSSSPAEKQTRLKQALEWQPASGAAQLELCAVSLDKGDLKATARCLDEDMKGKEGADPARLAKVRDDLAAAQLKVTEKERKALLAGGRPHQLKALVERFADTPEGKEASRRLRLLSSLCLDRKRFVEAVQKQMKWQAEEVQKRATSADRLSDTTAIARAYTNLGSEAKRRGTLLKQLVSELEAHPLKPGEDRAKTALHTALFAASDSALDLADELKRSSAEAMESYAAGAARFTSAWVGGVARRSKKVDEQLEDVEKACVGIKASE